MQVESALPRSLAGRALARLGVPLGSPSPALLDAVVGAYVRSVPWESASRIARHSRSPDVEYCALMPGAFWLSHLESGTGGTCFESNYALWALLRTIGFEGYLTINDMTEVELTQCHSAIVVVIDGNKILADVGMPLYVPILFDSVSGGCRRSNFHTYAVRPAATRRYTIERDLHPSPYCFTLVDEPVSETTYSERLRDDYGPEGLFLDRVIVSKVIDTDVWRYASKDETRFEIFSDGAARALPILGDVAAAIGRRFGMEESTVRSALEAVAAE